MSQSSLLKRLELYVRIQRAKRPALNTLPLKERQREKQTQQDLDELIKSLQKGHCHGFSIIYSAMGASGQLRQWEKTMSEIMDNRNWNMPKGFDWKKWDNLTEKGAKRAIDFSVKELRAMDFKLKNGNNKTPKINPIDYTLGLVCFYQGMYYSKVARDYDDKSSPQNEHFLAQVFSSLALFFQEKLKIDIHAIWNSEYNMFSNWFKEPSQTDIEEPSQRYIESMQQSNLLVPDSGFFEIVVEKKDKQGNAINETKVIGHNEYIGGEFTDNEFLTLLRAENRILDKESLKNRVCMIYVPGHAMTLTVEDDPKKGLVWVMYDPNYNFEDGKQGKRFEDPYDLLKEIKKLSGQYTYSDSIAVGIEIATLKDKGDKNYTHETICKQSFYPKKDPSRTHSEYYYSQAKYADYQLFNKLLPSWHLAAYRERGKLGALAILKCLEHKEFSNITIDGYFAEKLLRNFEACLLKCNKNELNEIRAILKNKKSWHENNTLLIDDLKSIPAQVETYKKVEHSIQSRSYLNIDGQLKAVKENRELTQQQKNSMCEMFNEQYDKQRNQIKHKILTDKRVTSIENKLKLVEEGNLLGFDILRLKREVVLECISKPISEKDYVFLNKFMETQSRHKVFIAKVKEAPEYKKHEIAIKKELSNHFKENMQTYREDTKKEVQEPQTSLSTKHSSVKRMLGNS